MNTTRRMIPATLAVLFSTQVSGACALEAAGQGRWYAQDSDAGAYRTQLALTGEASCNYQYGDQAVSARVFGRITQHDSARNHLDVRELLWTGAIDQIQLRAGVNTVFWGVLEFTHLVDIINQSDVLEDPFGEVKLGQPMFNASLRERWGSLDAYVMPRFRPRVYPDIGDPLRAAPPVVIASPLLESGRGRDRLDLALRYGVARGPLDLGITYFDGTSRDPAFIDLRLTDSGAVVTPYYPLIRQIGVEAQVTFGEVSLKLEAAYRDHDLTATADEAYALGLEYAFSEIWSTGIDLTAVIEYAVDHRQPPPVPSFLEHDLALGLRFAVNDVRSTEGKFGVIVDEEYGSRAWAMELSSRIWNRWKLSGKARWFDHVRSDDPLRIIHSDSYLDLSMIRYF